MILVKIIAVFVLNLAAVWEITGNPDAKRLYDDLLSNYNRLIRPVSNNTKTVLVKLGLRLSQLIDLVSVLIIIYNQIEFNQRMLRFLPQNLKDQILTTNVWLEHVSLMFPLQPVTVSAKVQTYTNICDVGNTSQCNH